MVEVQIRYWAGARAAAGVTSETIPAATVADALTTARDGRGEEFARVLEVCSVLVDGRRLDPDAWEAPLVDDVLVEVLPPFAGG